MNRLDVRTLLRVDAAMCVGSGLALAVAVGGWVRAVGVFLVVYGIAVGVLSSGSSPRVLRTGTLLTMAGDVGWVVATLVAVAVGAFATAAGTAVAFALAVPVAAMGVLKRAALHEQDQPARVLAAG